MLLTVELFLLELKLSLELGVHASIDERFKALLIALNGLRSRGRRGRRVLQCNNDGAGGEITLLVVVVVDVVVGAYVTRKRNTIVH